MATDANDQGHAEIERIRARIDTLITTHFGKGAPSYYLSQLGNELGDDRKLLERLTGTKISQFVEAEFTYEIGRKGVHENVLFLIAPGGGTEPPAPATPRYDSRFWAAFAVPLPEGEQRFIELETFEFRSDKDALACRGADIREIPADFLPAAAGQHTPAQIAEKITAWLEVEDLDPGRFFAQRRRQSRDGSSLLTQFLNALDKDQLKRVSLPLDVIRALDGQRYD